MLRWLLPNLVKPAVVLIQILLLLGLIAQAALRAPSTAPQISSTYVA
jgi:hypothetical protein